MSIITTFPFDNTANYSKLNTEVSGGAGRLALAPKPNQLFNQDFASSTGFTFDPAKAEFVAGVLQPKKAVIADEMSHVSAIINANADRSLGSNLATANAGATLATIGGKQYLDISGGVTDKSFSYDPLNADFLQTGTIRFKVITGYGATPSANRFLFDVRNSVGGANVISFFHQSTGNINMRIHKETGSLISSSLHSWVPDGVAEDEIEINFDFATGATRVFINGVQSGPTVASTFARSAITEYTVGVKDGSNKADFYMRDFQVFDTVQHTADFPLEVPRVINNYQGSTIDLPDFNYGLLGTIQSLDTFLTTEINVPRFTIENQYWNGSAWVASDGSYAQANDKATIVANISSIDMTSQTTVSAQVVFQADTIISNISDLTLTYTGQQYPLEGTLLTNNAFVAKDVMDFSAIEVKPVNTAILYAIEVGGVNMYWDGLAWVLSDGTSAQANTLADIIANIGTLLTANSSIKFLIILTTTAQDTATPEIDLISVTYDFGATEPSDPNQCQVFGFLKDSENQPIVGATVSAVPNRSDDEYKEAASRIIAKTIVKTTDANGFFSMNLIISDDYEVGAAQKMRYVLSIAITGQVLPVFKNGTLNPNQILFEVPNLASVNITDQIGAI